ncbi:MAG: hypothetical protein FJ319_10540 [SAR202 cluster bacterium]|nr:hypothetical protein [SAR202 cluster bacterium]
MRFYLRIHLSIVLLPLVLVLLLAACAPETDPFKVGERARLDEAAAANATPVATTGNVGGVDRVAVTPDPGLGTVRVADWRDNAVRLLNNIAGYIMVWGFDYKVDLIDVKETGYRAAADKGEVDLVMLAPKAETQGWKLADGGSAYGPSSDQRIGISSQLQGKAPELVEFFSKIVADKDAIASVSGQISEGRTGISPVVAALIFLKGNEGVWTQWVPAAVAEKVKASIASGKASLLKRACIPSGGLGSPGSPSCIASN